MLHLTHGMAEVDDRPCHLLRSEDNGWVAAAAADGDCEDETNADVVAVEEETGGGAVVGRCLAAAVVGWRWENLTSPILE